MRRCSPNDVMRGGGSGGSVVVEAAWTGFLAENLKARMRKMCMEEFWGRIVAFLISFFPLESFDAFSQFLLWARGNRGSPGRGSRGAKSFLYSMAMHVVRFSSSRVLRWPVTGGLAS